MSLVELCHFSIHHWGQSWHTAWITPTHWIINCSNYARNLSMFQQSSRIIRSLPPFHLARRRFNMATTATNPIIAAIENKEYEKAVDMILEGSCPLPEFPANPNETTKYKLVIHGGAGTLTRGMMPADMLGSTSSTAAVTHWMQRVLP